MKHKNSESFLDINQNLVKLNIKFFKIFLIQKLKKKYNI